MTSTVTSRISTRHLAKPNLTSRSIYNLHLLNPSRNRSIPNAGRSSRNGPISVRSFSSTKSSLALGSSSTTSSFSLPETISNFVAPLTPYLHDLPSTLHLSMLETSYPQAISILILTFLLRSTITLPISIWSRTRTRRMVDGLLPEWNADKKKLPIQVLKRCRRAGKSYEEYQEELKAELKIRMTQLIRKYDCSPVPSFVLPLLVHLPLFLFLSSLIRQGCIPPTPYSTEFLPWSTSLIEDPAFIEQARILVEKGMDTETLNQMKGQSGTSLVEKDSSLIGPVGLGMMTMFNVELGGYMRRLNREVTQQEEEISRKEEDQGGKEQKIGEKVEEESLRTTMVSNVLRAASIVFVPIAMQAPGALVIYWLSSSAFTLLQNSIFTYLDRRRTLASLSSLKLTSGHASPSKLVAEKKVRSSSQIPRQRRLGERM